MTFEKMVLASFMALALMACGPDNDQHDNKNNLPGQNDNHNNGGNGNGGNGGNSGNNDGNNGGNNGGNGNGGKTPAGADDLSNIEVTDKLELYVKGMGFYAKGDKSPLDRTRFEKTVQQSPSIIWSSKKDYDEDLYNFVALAPAENANKKDEKDDKNKNVNSKWKFAFDRIGLENQTRNVNNLFFGHGYDFDKYVPDDLIGASARVATKDGVQVLPYMLPAVPNTKMFMSWAKDEKSGRSFFKRQMTYLNGDDKKAIAPYSEEDVTSTIGSGKLATRVYGVNAFLTSDAKQVVDPKNGLEGGDKTEKYQLKYRKSTEYARHVNFVYYDDTVKRDAELKWDADKNQSVKPIEQYDGVKLRYPTDVTLGELRYAQFGRLTGQGLNPKSDPLQGYDDVYIKLYPLSKSDPAISNNVSKEGNEKSEDWYFARGTIPFCIDKASCAANIASLKTNKEGNIVFRGQALMFGLDYKPKNAAEKIRKPKEKPSTNSVKPVGPEINKQETLLDGKQNFVSMSWNPTKGTIKGEVYGIWTKGLFRVSSTTSKNTNTGKDYKAGDIVPVKFVQDGKKLIVDEDNKTLPFVNGADLAAKDYFDGADGKKLISGYASKLSAVKSKLVVMDGKVTKDGNSFSGKATRCEDLECTKGDKGYFVGAIFGSKVKADEKDARKIEDSKFVEVAGIINSQTGSMIKGGKVNKELTDPETKWGGSFAAQAKLDEPAPELHVDEEFSYNSSLELF